jgi:phosphatidylinositol alpha-1,6-mannosyltransferase
MRTDNKQILLILPEVFNCSGGIQMFCRSLCLAAANWSKENGASVSALVLNDGSEPDSRYVNGGFSNYEGARKSKIKFIRNFLHQIITNKFDWIIVGHISLSPLALLAKLFKPNIKIAVITYGIEVWGPLSKTHRKVLGNAEIVFAISDYTKDQLIKHNNILAERIKIFPCTLDPYWSNTSQTRGLESSPPVILSVNRMTKEDRYKGIDNVIRSLPAVLQNVGPFEYRVVGQGDDIPRLKALAAALGVSRYVNFLGGLTDEELREQYCQCSLFIMPSRKEGFGIVFLEAMAYGKPVIGGAHGGTPSVVKDGETGFLVDNSDVDGIADVIVRLLSDDEMRNSFGKAGYEQLAIEFTFRKFEQNFRDVFQPFT